MPDNPVCQDKLSIIETRNKQINRFIAKMPRLSTTVMKVLEICNGPDASASDLNRVISYDPVLTGQLIKLINSAFYGLSNRVTSLTHAIIMLGINTVKNMVLATSVISTFNGKTDVGGVSIHGFWAHCLCVGVIAKTIASMQQLPVNKQEELFVAGLMHDLGKIPLMSLFPEQYQMAIETAGRSQLQLYQSEVQHFGIDHCHVGRLIAVEWKLDRPIHKALGWHHESGVDPADVDLEIWAITSLANQLSKNLSIGFAGDADMDNELVDELSARLGMQSSDLEKLEPEIGDQIRKAEIFLRVAL